MTHMNINEFDQYIEKFNLRDEINWLLKGMFIYIAYTTGKHELTKSEVNQIINIHNKMYNIANEGV